MASTSRELSLEEIDDILFGPDSEFGSDIDDPTPNDDDDDDNTTDEDDMDEDVPATCSSTSNSLYWNKIDNSNNPIQLGNVFDYTASHKVIDFENLNPYECFTRFFPEKIYEHVAKETNKYFKSMIATKHPLPRRSRYHQWSDVTSDDIKAVVAIEIAMGILHKPTIESYFSESSFLFDTPGFREVFSRDKYQLIRSAIHFSDNDKKDGNDRLSKIRPILDMVKDLYGKYYVSNKEISIDENMIKFKGRLFFKQYLPSEASTEWGIKVWSMTDAHTGYLLKFNVYRPTGKDSAHQPSEGLGTHVVLSLLEGYENKGHIIYMDSFYNSVDLYDKLLEKKTLACGTVRINRKGLPSEIKQITVKKGALPVTWVRSDGKMLACSWQDTTRFNLLSSFGTVGTYKVKIHSKEGDREIDKPCVHVEYNKYMEGVDKFDQLCSTYPYKRKSQKWYQPIWHFIVEAALVNSNICYNIQNPTAKLDKKKLREKIINTLLEGYKGSKTQRRGRYSNPMESRLTERHFPAQYVDKNHKPQCIVCSILPKNCLKKGKGECKRKQTTYFCDQCVEKPPLCIIPCFETYHTFKVYKKRCQCGK